MGKLQTVIILIAIMTMAIIATVKAAEPEGPDTLTVVSSGRNTDNGAGHAVVAQAGNVSGITINDLVVTRNWQGYYGNVTGSIVLDDGFDQTFYQWELAEPAGEIYASNTSTVDWYTVKCLNFSLASLEPGYDLANNLTILSNWYNINLTEKDGINGTFNTTYSGQFQAGPVTIDSDEQWCPSAHTFVNEAWQSSSFETVILANNDSVIFTTFLEPTITGFNGAPTDFQMLVLENGKAGGPDLTTQTYYFFVELE